MANEFPKALLAGYGNYLEAADAGYKEKQEKLATFGQHPEVMVISCCDSRVTPEGVFHAGPGELFVSRNVANLVPPYEETAGQHGTSAALEYAVRSLKVKHVVIMGHALCGGIQAFRQSPNSVPNDVDFIGRWIKLLEPAAISMACMPIDSLDDPQRALEYAGVRQSLKNLMTFPFVKDAVEAGHLKIHGAWFNIGSGELCVMDPETQKFEPARSALPAA